MKIDTFWQNRPLKEVIFNHWLKKFKICFCNLSNLQNVDFWSRARQRSIIFNVKLGDTLTRNQSLEKNFSNANIKRRRRRSTTVKPLMMCRSLSSLLLFVLTQERSTNGFRCDESRCPFPDLKWLRPKIGGRQID